MRVMRWEALVEYDDGTVATIQFEEWVELGEAMEAGPDWNTIKVVYLHKVAPETAERE